LPPERHRRPLRRYSRRLRRRRSLPLAQTPLEHGNTPRRRRRGRVRSAPADDLCWGHWGQRARECQTRLRRHNSTDRPDGLHSLFQEALNLPHQSHCAPSARGEQQAASEVTSATEDEAAPASGACIIGLGSTASARNDVKRITGIEEQLAAHNCAKSAYSATRPSCAPATVKS
jgi:hypothetical protein